MKIKEIYSTQSETYAKNDELTENASSLAIEGTSDRSLSTFSHKSEEDGGQSLPQDDDKSEVMKEDVTKLKNVLDSLELAEKKQKDRSKRASIVSPTTGSPISTHGELSTGEDLSCNSTDDSENFSSSEDEKEKISTKVESSSSPNTTDTPNDINSTETKTLKVTNSKESQAHPENKTVSQLVKNSSASSPVQITISSYEIEPTISQNSGSFIPKSIFKKSSNRELLPMYNLDNNSSTSSVRSKSTVRWSDGKDCEEVAMENMESVTIVPLETVYEIPYSQGSKWYRIMKKKKFCLLVSGSFVIVVIVAVALIIYALVAPPSSDSGDEVS